MSKPLAPPPPNTKGDFGFTDGLNGFVLVGWGITGVLVQAVTVKNASSYQGKKENGFIASPNQSKQQYY